MNGDTVLHVATDFIIAIVAVVFFCASLLWLLPQVLAFHFDDPEFECDMQPFALQA